MQRARERRAGRQNNSNILHLDMIQRRFQMLGRTKTVKVFLLFRLNERVDKLLVLIRQEKHKKAAHLFSVFI